MFQKNIRTKINMTEKSIGQEFTVKSVNKKRDYFIEEVSQNELISKKHKKPYKIII